MNERVCVCLYVVGDVTHNMLTPFKKSAHAHPFKLDESISNVMLLVEIFSRMVCFVLIFEKYFLRESK